MRMESRLNKYNPCNPNRRAVEKRVAEIEAYYTKRAKKLDVLVTILIHFSVHISSTV